LTNKLKRKQLQLKQFQSSPRFFCVGHSKEVILADKPVAEAAVLHDAVKGPRHSRALSVRDVELLVGNQELRPDVLAGVDLLLRVPALGREGEAVLEWI
jgi:hypothetical protein